MQPLTNDATTALLRGLRSHIVNLMNFGPPQFEEIRSRSWASVTFTGARHEIAMRLEGEGAEAAARDFADSLDVTEFRLRGHILADIALVAQETVPGGMRLRIEALTVEDA
jgi:hypothetical protein